MLRKSSRIFNLALILSLLFGGWVIPATAAPEPPAKIESPGVALSNPIVSRPVTPANTTGMPAAPIVQPTGERRTEITPALPLPSVNTRRSEAGFTDPVRQTQPGLPMMPATSVNFEGQDISVAGGYAPPDTDGQVGPDHYIQMVNVTTAIYDKSGNLLYGPFNPSALWPTGDPCKADDGDPVVLYDQLADRWLLTQFMVTGPYYQCIAVSKGHTPTNNPSDWYLYSFLVSATKMNDYPKLGVWPDGYYMTANQFTGGASWGGAGVWAFDRVKMLAGLPATFQYFDLESVNSNYGGMLPSNWMGNTPPPAGAPNYFASVDQDWNSTTDDVLHLWAFHVDWATPANTTFTLVKELVVAPFEWEICTDARGACIEQPGTTNKVEGLNDRLMMHLWYRNFGDHESLVLNHTVDADGLNHAGIRWYELRSPGASAVIYQQGTYQPDTSHRWMGSIAQDHVGNMALGYSVSDATSVYPSIRYTGRLASDPLGTLPQGESTLIAGGGSQTDPQRWGDYSAMSVDPTDDCTFWYTQEYIAATGTWNWKTRIGAFKFPNCTMGPSGTLNGSVTDSVTSLPIAGAQIQAVNSASVAYTTASGSDGSYQVTLPVETYGVTASAYAYQAQTVSSLGIVSGTATTQNFALVPAPLYTVQGTVTDSATGWPLYARISIDGYPGGAIWTDPVTGQYSIDLAGGIAYTFHVQAFVNGYLEGSRAVGPLSANATEDFTLSADLTACTAPGYGFGGLVETFDAAVTPAGWSVTDAAGTGAVWAFNDPGADTNLTGGSGNFADADSDSAGSVDMDTTLLSPVIDLSGTPNPTLSFKYDFRAYTYGNVEVADVDVSVDGGTTWSNVWKRTGAADDRGPKTASIDLTALAGGQANTRLRFHYYNANFEYWWQVDDVTLGGGCQPGSGGLLVGQVEDGNTNLPITGALVSAGAGPSTRTVATPNDPNVGDGLYILYAEAGADTFTASQPRYVDSAYPITIVSGDLAMQDFTLAAGKLAAAPGSLSTTLQLGQNQDQSLTLTNEGTAAADYALLELDRGAQPLGPMEKPQHGVVKPWRQNFKTVEGTKLVAPPIAAPPFAAGNVIQSWAASAQGSPWGIAYDMLNDSVWVSEGWGSKEIYEYSTAGVPTGQVHPFPWAPASGPGDAAYNWNTQTIWVMDIGSGNCIHEIDPGLGATGNTICPAFGASQRGLAYDPSSDTWFAGGWNDKMIYHFTSDGTILDQVNVGLDIAGLAYNPTTMHLFVAVNAAPNPFYVLDAANSYAVIGQFNASQDFGNNAGAGVEIACDGSLWAVDQVTMKAYQIESGETTNVCALDVSWLSEAPINGTLAASANQAVTVNFDTTPLTQPGQYHAQLKLQHNTPYLTANVPVTLTVTAPSDWGKITGVVKSLGYCDAAPTPLKNAEVTIQGGSAAYTVTTDANGVYQHWLPQGQSPLSLQVTAVDYIAGSASNLNLVAGGTITQDFNLRWQKPCLKVNPASMSVTVPLNTSTARSLALTNQGAAAANFSLLELPASHQPLSTEATANDTASQTTEVAPTSHRAIAPMAPGAELFQVDAGASTAHTAILGVEWAQGSYWVTSGGATGSGDPNYLFQLDKDGNVLNSWLQGNSDTWGWRDLAFDGTYLYASYSGVLNQINPATGATTGVTIPCPDNPCRGLAYDPATDHFWTANFTNNLYEFTRAGTVVHSFTNALSVYGLAWDKYSAGGPYLWAWSQDGTPLALATQINPTTGVPTGVSFAGTDIPTGSIAGGAAIISGDHPDYPGKLILAGMQQADSDTIIGYDLETLIVQDIPWLKENPISGAVAADGSGQSQILFTALPTMTLGTHLATLQVKSDDPLKPAQSIPVTMTIVPVAYGLVMDPTSAAQSGNSGATVTYPVTITNTGNVTDSFNLSKTGGAWTVDFPATVGPLAAGAHTTVNAVVHIPAGLAAGTNDVVALNIASQGDATKKSSAVLITTVGTLRGLLVAPATNAKSGEPGATVTYQVTLTNTGNTSDSFNLNVNADGWTVDAPATVGPLAAGAHITIDVVVHIPAGAANGASKAVTLTFASQGDATKTGSAVLTTTVVITQWKIYMPLVVK